MLFKLKNKRCGIVGAAALVLMGAMFFTGCTDDSGGGLQEEANNAGSQSEDGNSLQARMKEIVDDYGEEYGIYDINNDGLNDMVIHKSSDDIDIGGDSIKSYEILICDGKDFESAGDIKTQKYIIGLGNGQMYAFADNTGLKAMMSDQGTSSEDDEMIDMITEYYFEFEVKNGEISNNTDLDVYCVSSGGEAIYIRGDNEMSDSELDDFVTKFDPVIFYSSDDYTPIDNM